MHNEYERRKEFEANDQPYNGPMDDETYRILNTYPDPDATRGLYQGKNVNLYQGKNVNGAQPFVFYSLYFSDSNEAEEATAHLANSWPGQQFEVQGAWNVETGLPLGMYYDDFGNVAGRRTYVLLPDAYAVIPGATSNEDLEDLNLTSFQHPRSFM
jgi:hypothetical protein